MASTSSQHVFEFIGKVDSLQKSSKQAADSLGKVEKSTQKVGAASKAFLAGAGVAAVGAFAVASVKMAVAAEDAGSKFEQVFGPNINKAQAFVEQFANKAGFAEHEMQDMLATTANVAQGLGATGDEALTLSTDLATMAGDVASFNGATSDTPAVLAAMQSALTGERDALKTYGIVISEADVQTQAFIETGKTQADELTKVEKAQATLTLITERAGAAVGDLDKTADGTSNTMARLTAEFKDAQVAFGEALVPALSAGMGVVEDLIPLIEQFGEGLKVVIDAVLGLEGGMVQAAAAAPILAGALYLLYANPVIAGIGLVVAGIVAIGAAAANEKRNVEALTEDLEALGKARPETITELIDPDALDVANDMGISIEELIDVIAGSADDFDTWVGNAREAGFELENVQDRSRLLTDAVSNLRQDLDDASVAVEGNRDALAKQTTAASYAREAQAKLADAQGEAEDATRDHTDALQKQMDKLRAALDPVFAFRDAKRSQRDAEKEATAALEEFGQNSPEYREALDNLTESTLDTKEAALGLAGVDLDKYRDELIKSGIRSGLTAQQAEKMADDIIADLERINDKVLEDKDFTVTTVYQSVGSATGSGHGAAGGHFNQGDVALVGELGPEVVQFGAPGTVFPNNKIPSIGGGLAAGGGFTQVIVVNLNQPVVGDRALQDIVVQSITHAQQRGRLPKPDRQDVAPVKRQRSA